MPTTSNFVYFSFLPAKQRDFPGNFRSGGCDSLPLVVAFTSKQHDSPLSYALHFLHIISHQMCCAGERAECRAHQSVGREISPPSTDKNARKAGGIWLSRAASLLCAFIILPNWYNKRGKTRSPDKLTVHLSPEQEHRGLWYSVYFRRRLGPTVTCYNPAVAWGFIIWPKNIWHPWTNGTHVMDSFKWICLNKDVKLLTQGDFKSFWMILCIVHVVKNSLQTGSANILSHVCTHYTQSGWFILLSISNKTVA